MRKKHRKQCRIINSEAQDVQYTSYSLMSYSVHMKKTVQLQSTLQIDLFYTSYKISSIYAFV
jgi:hypothetical protein